jgi:uncharacterized integral membrane protein
MIERFNALRARIRLALIVIGLVVFIIFLLQNTDQTPVRLLFFDAEIPVAVLVVVMALGGFVVGYYTAFTGGRRRRKQQVLKQEAKEARQHAPSTPEEKE